MVNKERLTQRLTSGKDVVAAQIPQIPQVVAKALPKPQPRAERVVVPAPLLPQARVPLPARSEEAFVPCDTESIEPEDVLLLASKVYRTGDYAQANACAQMAADLIPEAVEAQHLRAASLIALGKNHQAQVAFAMALALDPYDPQTLADAADFYINILTPKSRDTVKIGLAYAQTGSFHASVSRLHRKLRGRLSLLEAEAFSDMYDPQMALMRTNEALAFSPGIEGGENQLALSLFQLSRFSDSERAFQRVLRRSPKDAFAHHHLGLIYERKGRPVEADRHFQQAQALSEEFFAPVPITQSEFRAELDRAISELPPVLAALVARLEIKVSDVPLDADLNAASPPFSPTILGLYRGPAVMERPDTDVRTLILYRKNIARSVRDRSKLNEQIRKTLRHELGHAEGYDEDELRRRGLE